MEIKNYTLSVPIKKQLGKIIKILRKQKYEEFKRDNLIETNPYTKENFCEDNKICHYHTLTKLEEDYIRDDRIYHLFLNKLGISFQVKNEVHGENMMFLTSLCWKVLDKIEFCDDDINTFYQELSSVSFINDCISTYYLNLLKFSIKIYLNNKIELKELKINEALLPMYRGIFKGLAYHAVGLGFYLLEDYLNAEKYSKEAIESYKPYKVSIGLSYTTLIDTYIKNNNYYEAIQLCNVLEEYYIKTNNKKRLMSIYNYLVDYYLLINSLDYAKRYYDKAINLVNNDRSKYICLLHYNWGRHEMSIYQYEEALNYFVRAYNICDDKEKKLMVINLILMCMSILKKDTDINEYLIKGQECYHNANNLDRLIFDYFMAKDKKANYEILAQKEIIPMLKKMSNYKPILLFFYEDLHKIS